MAGLDAAAPKRKSLSLPQSREMMLVVIIVLVMAAASAARPSFLDMENIGNILLEAAQVTLLGLGMMTIIIAGGIDVSVGAGITFAASFVGKALLAGWSLPLVLLLAVAVGAVIGCLNGFLIGVSRVHPIIITLGTMNIYRTLTLYVLGG